MKPRVNKRASVATKYLEYSWEMLREIEPSIPAAVFVILSAKKGEIPSAFLPNQHGETSMVFGLMKLPFHRTFSAILKICSLSCFMRQLMLYSVRNMVDAALIVAVIFIIIEKNFGTLVSNSVLIVNSTTIDMAGL